MRLASGCLLALCGLLLFCASASALSPPRFRALTRAGVAASTSLGLADHLQLNPDTDTLTEEHVKKIKLDESFPKTTQAIKKGATFKSVILALVDDVGSNVDSAHNAIRVIAAAVATSNEDTAEGDLLGAYQLALNSWLEQQGKDKQEELEEKEPLDDTENNQVEVVVKKQKKKTVCKLRRAKDVSATISNGIHFFSNEIQGFNIDEAPILSAVVSAIKLAQNSILIVSDQFSEPTVQEALIAAMTANVRVIIITGADSLEICDEYVAKFEMFKEEKHLFIPLAADYKFPIDKIRDLLKEDERDVRVDIKMHNKFMVIDDKLVLIGSPNYTPPGLGPVGFNVEALITVANKDLAQLYSEYGRLIELSVTDNTFPHTASFRSKENRLLIHGMKEMDKGPIRPCLAPVCNLFSFFNRHLHPEGLPSERGGIKSIIVTQFLVSSSTPYAKKLIPVITKQTMAVIHGVEPDNYHEWVEGKDDIVHILAMWRDKVTLFWDLNAYAPKKNEEQKQFNVKISNTLIDAGASLFTVKVNAIFHNKLILIAYGDGISFTTIIGSAGFTYSVQQNINCENMVAIDGKELYDAALQHVTNFNKKRTVKPIEKVEL